MRGPLELGQQHCGGSARNEKGVPESDPGNLHRYVEINLIERLSVQVENIPAWQSEIPRHEQASRVLTCPQDTGFYLIKLGLIHLGYGSETGYSGLKYKLKKQITRKK